MTETLTFNRSDWSGREISIEVDREAQTFKLHDYSFRWEITAEDDGEGLVFESFKVFGDAWGDEYPIVKAGKLTWTDKPKWSDKVWIASHMGIERDHSDPVVACAQVLCNTI